MKLYAVKGIKVVNLMEPLGKKLVQIHLVIFKEIIRYFTNTIQALYNSKITTTIIALCNSSKAANDTIAFVFSYMSNKTNKGKKSRPKPSLPNLEKCYHDLRRKVVCFRWWLRNQAFQPVLLLYRQRTLLETCNGMYGLPAEFSELYTAHNKITHVP